MLNRSARGRNLELEESGRFDTRVRALHAADVDLAVALFLREVNVPAAPMAHLLQHGPTAAVWRPIRDPEHRVGWMDPQTP